MKNFYRILLILALALVLTVGAVSLVRGSRPRA